MKPVLFAFDCDHTLVEKDSDFILADIKKPLPTEITSLIDGHYWTKYMNAVFRHLHGQGVDLDTISDAINSIPLVKGMSQLFGSICKQNNAQLVIISDANDFGISRILSRLLKDADDDMVSSVKLLTNRSFITDSGCLQIIPFHTQWDCQFCPQNLCKGSALSAFIKENGPYHQIVYVGDGKNDICPATILSQDDIVFARKGYDLQRIILDGEKNGKKVELKATVKFWDDGFDILPHILQDN